MDQAPRSPSNRNDSAGPRIRQRIGAPDARARRRRTITLVLLGAVGILLVNSIVGENGYLARLRAEREEMALTAAVARLRLENRALQEERQWLQSDPSAVEETARRVLGVIRPGETVVIVRDAPPIPSETPMR
jgi:cell division protein FtsB